MSTPVAHAVAAAISQVFRDTGRPAKPVEPGMLLAADLGLDSLDLAQTIVILERTLSVDPFRSAPAEGGRPTIRKVADLVGLYERAVATAPDDTTSPNQAEFSQRVSQK